MRVFKSQQPSRLHYGDTHIAAFLQTPQKVTGTQGNRSVLWGLENSLSSCPGPVGEPQLPFLARETKMEGIDPEIQYHMGGAFRASSVGALDKTQRKVQEGLLSSKTTVLCSPRSGHRLPQAFWGLPSASRLPTPLPTLCLPQALLSVVSLQPH